jgi:light-regulated signal transduction histidine kinase (bacteriophytochrome)
VEDNPGDVLLIQETLGDRQGEFELESVERLAPALERLRTGGIHVVLLDLTLPDSAGLGTFTAVRASAPDVPIVVLTGLSDEALAVSTVRAGAQDYLVKGQVAGNLLARTMRYAIERHQVRHELESSEQQLRAALEQIRILNQDLERRVADRTSELAAAYQELEAFTYSVSHDLRAPLRHVTGFAQMLAEETGGQLSPTARDYLERIQQRAVQMGAMVDDLLKLARLGRQPLHPRLTPLTEIVGAVIAELESEVAGRLVEWQVRELPVVACDAGLLGVVFTNLLSNAVKYTRPRAPAVIEVGETTRDGERAFFVKDNGVGFEMKYADRLFGVFQRLHRKEEFEGTGVGLATVQRIIHKHGGRIWAEATPDRGASFYFTLNAPTPRLPRDRHRP